MQMCILWSDHLPEKAPAMLLHDDADHLPEIFAPAISITPLP